MRAPIRAAVVLLIGALASGCARGAAKAPAPAEPASATEPPSGAEPPTEPPKDAPPSGPFVPAGKTLDIELLDAIGTDVSTPGQAIHALVREDVTAEDGTIVAERGAVLYGIVAGVGTGPTPHLELELGPLRTARGDATVSTKLVGAKKVPVGEAGVYDPDTSTWDAVFSAAYPPGPSGYAAPGESILYQDWYDEHTRTLHVPAGAVLVLELRAPLVPKLPDR